MSRWREGFKQVRNYPSAILGLALIAFLFGLAAYTVVFLSFEEAELHWRGQEAVRQNPINAWPAWINAFGYDLPETMVLTSEEDATVERDGSELRIEFEFDYTYSDFPSEMALFLEAEFDERLPYARMRWHTPAGEVFPLGSRSVGAYERVSITQDSHLERFFYGKYPHVGLLSDPRHQNQAEILSDDVIPALGEIVAWVADDEQQVVTERLGEQFVLTEEEAQWVFEEVRALLAQGVDEQERLAAALQRRADELRATAEVLPGTYRIEILVDLMHTEEDAADVRATFVSYGLVHGVAGTDHMRRDLSVALMWGTPVALAFGLLAAVGTTITTLIIAAIGVWFGGIIDATIQRITEVNIILPLLPILVMIGTLYSTSIWLMLGVVILLGIFSASIKMYRAMLLPIRESPYIEAARAYGAGNFRIVFRYMIPRVLPVLIPSFVTLIPTYVFLEASLAVLGLGDPTLPTWGKLLHDAQEHGALEFGHYYWVLAPTVMLMLTGLGFAMFGFALDRIFNPRLRRI